jgi:NAD(P)-dependent dehydrogenase (short-subunit alcohol dehydrogenase family)
VFALSRSGAAPPGSPEDIVAMPCDVLDPANVRSSFARVLDSAQRIDVLINNAGAIGPIGKMAEVDTGAWSRLMRINLEGPYLCARAVLDGMIKAGKGTIINITSGAAVRPLEGWS